MSIRVNPCPSVSDADPGPSFSWRSSSIKHLPALGLLLLFWVMAVSSVLDKSATFDEPLHLAGGYGYWTQNEYLLSTENGNLAQRWAALPLLLGHYTFPSGDRHDNFKASFDFFYNSGNDAKSMLLQGRVMISLLGVALGLLVYAWSSRLFGYAGGLISLVLYAFSPAILAHSRLATSDLVVTFCFAASLWSLWRLLHRISIATLAINCLALGALFVSKMSAVLIVPVGLVLLVIRLFVNEPLPIRLWERERSLTTRTSQIPVFLCVIVLQVMLVSGIVSAFYGFRYSASKPSAPTMQKAPVQQKKAEVKPAAGAEAKKRAKQQPEARTKTARKAVTVPGYIKRIMQVNREFHLLPEAYLHGLYVVTAYSLVRPAFFNGEYGTEGWRWFFPYCFLVKTPIPLFIVLFLAALASAANWIRLRAQERLPLYKSIGKSFYRTSPLWVFLLAYWTVAVNTGLNIGERHILPVYPATFILAGAASGWLRFRSRLIPAILGILLLAFAVESLRIWPNYLAYFNQIVGGPKNAYRHLVDSSLDWGQDLPQLKKWMERNGLDAQSETAVYLSYFGNGNPTYYGINAQRLPGYLDADLDRPELLSLQGGVYCISATMLQMVHIAPAGPWNEEYERNYQSLQGFAR
ncbi:MAG: glycosyltransferase family 39 protein, partial [Desulforhabdus sp.]|nr:glycosyltransferase family 39 protein [Desulforhabdus sp.]